jgi:HAD superfamily hydrolase (TIGR01549 family)
VPQKITAVTFDLWNTIYSGDIGDADKVRPKRMQALAWALARSGVDATPEQLEEAYATGFDAYLAAWSTGEHYGAREQVLHILSRFGAVPSQEVLQEAAWSIEEASRLAHLRLLPGVAETIPALAEAGFSLGIISDTSLTPGRIITDYLRADGLLDHFSALTYSDETGFPKPDRRMFLRTLERLGAQPSAGMHVGDMPRTDIAGARAVGMVAVRFAGGVDNLDPPEADFVIRDHRELPAVIASVAREPARA